MSYRAAIFDFDGTLVDTMPHHFEAYRRVLATEGIELAPETFFASIGGIARETIPKLLRGADCRLSVAEIHAAKQQTVGKLFADEPPPALETSKLLPVFHGQLRMAIASSGSRAGIEQILAALDWMHYFDAIIAGEDAAQGKPAPDLFLLAAERLGVRPSECIVFEDTDAGVEAGRRAGMLVFDVRKTNAVHPGESRT